MTFLQHRTLVDRRKIASWHTLWELGQARAALRRMGEVLPAPEARSREAFADAIYGLADEGHTNLRVLAGSRVKGSRAETGQGLHAPAAVPIGSPHLAGGQGENIVRLEQRPGPEGKSAAVGGKPSVPSGVEVPRPPTHLETEESV